MLSDLRYRVRSLLRRKTVDAELAEELRFHLDELVHKHEKAGVSHEEAVRLARMEFGGLEQITAECRDARGVSFLETLLQDLRYAARVLVKDRSFSLLAVVTLALGIGASTTVVSVLNAVLLKPLPYDGVDRIVFPWRLPPPTAEVGFDVYPWGRLDFLTLSESPRTFEHLGAFLGSSFNLTGRGEPARFDGARVSAGFFSVLGVAPELGRTFREEEDRPGAAKVVVLSHRLWRDRFGGDLAILGRAIDLDGAPHTVLGVMPEGFSFPQSAGMPDVFVLPPKSELWVPLALSQGPRVRGEPAELAVIGRLTPEANLEIAQAELDRFSDRMEEQIPQAKGWFHARPVPIGEQLLGRTERPLLLLVGAVAVLLLIACSNVASLLLARSCARNQELALRTALGAGRGRLVRQLTTEHLVLAVLGGAAGLLLAVGGVEIVKAFGPANVPRLASVSVDAGVLAFSIGLTFITGILFGMAPAWAVAREDLVASFHGTGGRSAAIGGRSRAHRTLLVTEVALALVLVIAAGLLVRTFVHLTTVDAGFDPAHVLTFELTLPSASYTDEDRIVSLYRDALERLRAIPGVESVGIGETVPMGGAGESTGLRIPERADPAATEPPYANYTIVSPGYLGAVGTPLLRGRDFLETDTATSMPVAMVSAAMARKYWPGEDVIGRQVGLPIRPFDMTIVGLVADVKHVSLREEPGPEIYVPYTQKPWPSMLTMHVALRAHGDPAALTESVREAIRGADPDIPLAAVTTLETIVADSMAQPRFSTLLVGGFGLLSLLLASVGLYGAVSYSVASRSRELGIRLALGAPKRRVFALVMRESVRLTALGIAIGVALALLLLRTMASFLYGVESSDAVTFVSLSLLFLAVTLVASYVPARRAVRVDPVNAMRTE